jgi:Na+-transporting methylmalonyl-CoA/oxaloacetate decarboxylase gamma subunit
LDNIYLSGLEVAVAGLIITFMSLGLFAVVISVLGKIFKYKEPAAEKTEDEGESNLVSEAEAAPVDEDADLPVVIATAISYFHARSQSSLGISLEEGKSGWWSANRMKAQQGIGLRITRSGK